MREQICRRYICKLITRINGRGGSDRGLASAPSAAGSDMICLISHDQFDWRTERRWPVAGQNCKLTNQFVGLLLLAAYEQPTFQFMSLSVPCLYVHFDDHLILFHSFSANTNSINYKFDFIYKQIKWASREKAAPAIIALHSKALCVLKSAIKLRLEIRRFIWAISNFGLNFQRNSSKGHQCPVHRGIDLI